MNTGQGDIEQSNKISLRALKEVVPSHVTGNSKKKKAGCGKLPFKCCRQLVSG